MRRLKELEEKAIARLKLFEPNPEFEDPYYLAYSGGKDSDVILVLAELAGVRYEAVHNLTSADAPETVYYVKSKPNVKIDKPRTTMWKLIPEKAFPPTRLFRYCCSELKERGGQCHRVITGVRWAESAKRKENAGVARILKKPKATMKIAEEIGADYIQSAQGGIILNNDNEKSRELVEHCVRQSKVMVNPIVDWTDNDVWEFLRYYGVEGNPLYQCGFKRIGCIGCPNSDKSRYFEFRRYPKYKENYIRAFDRMLKVREERGLKHLDRLGTTGEEVFKWWMQEDPAQLSFSDLDVF